MCPISGIMQFVIIIVTLIVLLETVVVHALNIKFEPKNATVCMYDSAPVNFTLTFDPGDDVANMQLNLTTENDYIAKTTNHVWLEKNISHWKGTFNVTGNFLGKTKILCNTGRKVLPQKMDIIVIRRKRVIDTVFTASVITLVSIIYINFGCALNWGELRKNLRRPIGPVIGFIGQFLIMPVLSFILGKLLFPDSAEMQIGMFFTGVSPAGGASNIWTVMLDGNMDLSVTMTTISTIAAFGMMPLWIFTLGKLIFDNGKLTVPYAHISSYAVGLIIPLAIGYLISRYMKRVAQFLVRILKGFSAFLILFIIVFAIVTNLYLFELFSWQIVVAGMGLPYIGYVLAYIIARILRQPDPDCLAIAIETGIQNTGIAIFLLRVSLSQPEADLTTVAPVAVAVMTPFPLIIMLIYKRFRQRLSRGHQKLPISKESSAESNMLDGNSNSNKVDQSISTIT